MKLYELDATGIDRELEKTAQGIGQTQDALQGDTSPMGGLNEPDATDGELAGNLDTSGGAIPGGGLGDAGLGGGLGGAGGIPNTPDPNLGGIPGDIEAEQEEVKKINDALVAAVSGMPYVDEYDHDENSKITPEKIMQMNIDDLTHLRNLATNKINMISLHDKVGMYDDPGVKWYHHLRDFTDKVLSMKKKADRPAKNKKEGKTASYRQQEASKNAKSGKAKKPKMGG